MPRYDKKTPDSSNQEPISYPIHSSIFSTVFAVILVAFLQLKW